MDAHERSAAVHAAGSAVAHVARAAGEVHQAVLGIVGGMLRPVPAARLPLGAAALIARANYAIVATTAEVVATVAAPVVAATAAPDAVPAHHRPRAVGWLAAVSGAVGDSLIADARMRPLTVPMAPRSRGLPVSPGSPRGEAEPGTTLAVLVHGLCCHESNWGRQCLSAFGSAATAVTVRYTTGQPIAASGAELADVLEQAVADWPQAVERIVLIGHSMGGLVIREALARGGTWRGRVTDVVTLGTPHTGAPLERGARAALGAASAFPVSAPLAALGDARSAGIKDLAHGDVAPAAHDVSWHLVAGTIGPRALQHRIGDGMVGVASALSAPEGIAARRLVIRGAGHMSLLDHPQVADLLAGVIHRVRLA